MRAPRELLRRLLSDLPVKVICLSAAVIMFLFNRINSLSDRFVSVPLTVDVPAGFALASAYPRTVRITLRGEEASINAILEEDLEASVSLEDRRDPGVYRTAVRVERRGTALDVEPLEVRVDPQEISFTLEPLLERRVDVAPDIKGVPAYGYELAGYELSPRAAVLRGPRSRVQAASTLLTEEVDLTGRTGPFTLRVRIVMPDTLLSLAGDPFVEFKASIKEAVVSRRFEDVEVVVLDAAAGLKPAEELPAGSVQVQGSQLAVEALQTGQVRLVVEGHSIRRTGTWTLPTRPEVPSSVTVLDWSPKELTVLFGGPVR
ncbi:MAG: CdaR family protein [Spirochaetes bacterium]|nr:CdaR family protein [Spirochaetota bacterium]